jgi:hypothetical protein
MWQRFADHVCANRESQAGAFNDDGADVYDFHEPVVFDGAATRAYQFNCSIRAVASMGTMLVFRNMPFINMRGSLGLKGLGGAGFSTRTCDKGISFENCGGMNFDCNYYLTTFKIAGMCADSRSGGNNNTLHIGPGRLHFCGPEYSLYDSFGVTADFTNPVNDANPGSFYQRTTINVDTIPPPAAFAAGPVFAFIGTEPGYSDNYLYRVYEDTPNTVKVFPWINQDMPNGKVWYVWGGAIVAIGQDSNVLKVDQAKVQHSSVALGDYGLYGMHSTACLSENCAIGLALGRDLQDAYSGGSHRGLYHESSGRHIAVNSEAVWNCSIISNHELKTQKIALPLRRNAANELGPYIPSGIEFMPHREWETTPEPVPVPPAQSSYDIDVALAANESAYRQTTPIFSNAIDGTTYANIRMGGVVRCLDNTIIALTFSGEGGDFGTGDITYKTITYDGATKALTPGPLQMFADGATDPDGAANDGRYISCSYVLHTIGPNRGRITFLYLWRNLDATQHRIMSRYTDDNGTTFSVPVEISSQFPLFDWALLAFSGTSGVQLPSGRLVLPAWHSNPNYATGGTGVDKSIHPWVYRSILVYSDDGVTWSVGAEAPIDELKDSNESALALDDGVPFWAFRSVGMDYDSNARFMGHTEPDGERIVEDLWKMADENSNKIIATQVQGGLIQAGQEGWQSSKLALTMCHSDVREKPTLFLSYDKGQTWPYVCLINATGGYSAPTTLDESTWGVLWEKYPGYSEVSMTAVNLAEIFQI